VAVLVVVLVVLAVLPVLAVMQVLVALAILCLRSTSSWLGGTIVRSCASSFRKWRNVSLFIGATFDARRAEVSVLT